MEQPTSSSDNAVLYLPEHTSMIHVTREVHINLYAQISLRQSNRMQPLGRGGLFRTFLGRSLREKTA